MLRRHVPTLEERRIAENRLLALYGEHRDALLADIQPNPDISQLMLPATLEMRPSWRAYVIMTTLALGISFCLANFLMPVGRTGADVFIGFLIIAIILLVTLSSFNLAAYNSLTVTDVGIERRSFLTRHFLAWSDITLFAIEPTSSSHCYTVFSEKLNIRVLHPDLGLLWYYFNERPQVRKSNYHEYLYRHNESISVIAARTKLPLYDLRKTYPKGDTHDDVSRERISHR